MLTLAWNQIFDKKKKLMTRKEYVVCLHHIIWEMHIGVKDNEIRTKLIVLHYNKNDITFAYRHKLV